MGEEDRASGGGGGEPEKRLEYQSVNGPPIEKPKQPNHQCVTDRYRVPRHPYRLAMLGTSPNGGSLHNVIFPIGEGFQWAAADQLRRPFYE